MTADVLTRLRGATRDNHERLEQRLNILERMASSEGRGHLVRRFHALHAGAEAVLAPWLADLPGLDFEHRRRVALLADDLRTLKVAPSAPAVIARPACAGEAMGMFYVLEGSSLGAKVIRRQAALRGLDMAGLSFLDPYGSRTAERWRGFLDVLDRESAARGPAWDDAVVKGGREGFAQTEAWLCGDVVAV